MKAAAAELEGRAGRVRRLVAQGRYDEARRELEEYGRMLERYLESTRPGDAVFARMDAEWRRLIEEMRRQVLAGRAHAAARLTQLPRCGRAYGQSPGARHIRECLG